MKSATGHNLRILSEYEEAKFIGAGIAQDPEILDSQNFMAFDLGGGSLEKIIYQDGSLKEAKSFQLGAVRLTRAICESFGRLPLSQAECVMIHDKVLQTLPQAQESAVLIGSGGAFTVSRAILLSRLPGNKNLTTQELFSQNEYKQISVEDLQELTQELQSLHLEDRAKIPHLPPGRADIIPVALQIVLAIAEKYGARAWQQSFYNLRFGLAASLLSGEFHKI